MKSCLTYAILCIGLLAASCRKRYADYTENSGFDRTQCDSAMLENLTVTGRVWGYVKYHHPVFAGRKFNVDYELFELLPRVADADFATRNRVLAQWIDGLGEFSVDCGRYDALPENSLGPPRSDPAWTSDTTRLGAALSERLLRLRYADRKGNRHVTECRFEGEDLKNPNAGFWEDPYPQLTMPDYGYRLLALFRFWNRVEYYFPSKYLIDRPWAEVLPEYVARMASLPDGDYCPTAWRMIAEVQDSHDDCGQAFLRIFGGWRLPQQTTFVGSDLIVSAPDTLHRTPPENFAPFQVGDRIEEIEHRPVAWYLDRTRTYIPASNEARVRALASDLTLRAHANTSLRIRYIWDGILRDTLVKTGRQPYIDRAPKHGAICCKRLEDGIRHVNPACYRHADEQRVDSALLDEKGCVIDLRNGAFGTFYADFNPKKNRHCIVPDSVDYPRCYTYPQILLPGVFSSVSGPHKTVPVRRTVRTVLLVRTWTQSASESLAMWLQQRSDGVTVGSRTAGADGTVTPIDLPGGIRTCFSGLGWYYPDGREVQRNGLLIDREAEPTLEDLLAGRDPAHELAMQLIGKEKT